jgi:hypothetical protein
VNDRQLGAVAYSDLATPVQDRITPFSKVNSDQNVFILHEEVLLKVAMRSVWLFQPDLGRPLSSSMGKQIKRQQAL